MAEKLYDYLFQKGYSPWLDKKKLKPGANWDYEIKKALIKSTFVILLLSSTSVNKRGYVQKEFKYAVDYYENKLVDDIYIIPFLDFGKKNDSKKLQYIHNRLLLFS